VWASLTIELLLGAKDELRPTSLYEAAEIGAARPEETFPGELEERVLAFRVVEFAPMQPPTDDLERSKARALSGSTRWSYEHSAAWAIFNGLLAGTAWGVTCGLLGIFGSVRVDQTRMRGAQPGENSGAE
jgi:hypothetical protein